MHGLVSIKSESFLNSVQVQVKAAEIANEGIAAEYERGSGRTTLDVIQSNLFIECSNFFSNSEKKLSFGSIQSA